MRRFCLLDGPGVSWPVAGQCRRLIADRADDAIGRCGLGALCESRVGDLPTGQRRLVELARAMATPFRYLLLDEPSSGLDIRETEHFGQIVTGLVSQSGIGILLVEHDMALIAKVCSYVYVLDFGQLIYEGSTSEVLSSELVRAAYLGSSGNASDADSADKCGGASPLLELRNIRAGYGTGKVLENVSLVVPDGSVVALLGPNGAGKTTLLRVASGLLAPSAGEVIFDGKDMTGADAYVMAKAGVCHVPEGRGVFPTLSVADNLRLQAPPAVDRQALDRIAPRVPTPAAAAATTGRHPLGRGAADARPGPGVCRGRLHCSS